MKYLDVDAPKGYRIITWGDIEKAREKRLAYHKFTCDYCGCVFEADKDHYECHSDQREMSTWYKTVCPCCGEKVTT